MEGCWFAGGVGGQEELGRGDRMEVERLRVVIRGRGEDEVGCRQGEASRPHLQRLLSSAKPAKETSLPAALGPPSPGPPFTASVYTGQAPSTSPHPAKNPLVRPPA
jgi:hypothetical protein